MKEKLMQEFERIFGGFDLVFFCRLRKTEV